MNWQFKIASIQMLSSLCDATSIDSGHKFYINLSNKRICQVYV